MLEGTAGRRWTSSVNVVTTEFDAPTALTIKSEDGAFADVELKLSELKAFEESKSGYCQPRMYDPSAKHSPFIQNPQNAAHTLSTAHEPTV